MKYGLILSVCVCSLLSLGLSGGSHEMVVVPNVEGISLELAGQMLRSAGLQPQGASAALDAVVTRQNPRPGFQVTVGSAVVLFFDNYDRAAATPPPQGGVSSIQASGQPQPVVSQTAVAPQPAGVGIMSGTQVMVTPTGPHAASLQGLSVVQGASGQFVRPVVMYEPVQSPVSPYFAPMQVRRAYPIWYPRQLIPSSATSASSVTSTQQQRGYTPQFIPAASTAAAAPGWRTPATGTTAGSMTIRQYPALETGEDASYYITSTTRVGLINTTTSPAVSVPYVVRLSQQDAVAALTKAGLSAGAPKYVDSAQVRSGSVVKQSPPHRQLVPAGTQIQLWLAR